MALDSGANCDIDINPLTVGFDMAPVRFEVVLDAGEPKVVGAVPKGVVEKGKAFPEGSANVLVFG